MMAARLAQDRPAKRRARKRKQAGSFRRLPAVLALLASLAGCTVGPDYHRPAVALPPSLQGSNSQAVPAGQPGRPGPAMATSDQRWWQIFKDPVLQGLIRQARLDNPDVHIAAARIDAVEAQFRALQGSYLPQVSAVGNETLQRISPIGLPRNRTTGNPAGSATIFGAQATWEIDFWGKYRRANEAARAGLLASRAARAAVLTTLVCDVASTYFNLLALDEEHRLLQQQLALRKQAVALEDVRQLQGVAMRSDVLQAQANVAGTEQQVADNQRRMQTQQNAMETLLGQTPGPGAKPVPRGLPLFEVALPSIGAGVPSELLERRPDIQEAEQNLVAANANIGVAEAAYFPNIGLTAQGGQESTAFHNLISSQAATWLLQPEVNVPIFTGGQIHAQVLQARAEHDALVSVYRQTVIGAFRDVADALADNRAALEEEDRQATMVAQAGEAVSLAQQRLAQGVAGSLDAIGAEESELAARSRLASAQQLQLDSVVYLYRALGGGWQ